MGSTAIYNFQHLELEPSYMSKIIYHNWNTKFQFYLAQNLYQETSFGSRISSEIHNMELGSALIINSLNHYQARKYQLEFDVVTKMFKGLNLIQQISRIQAEDVEIQYHALLSNKIETKISILEAITPYSGYHKLNDSERFVAGVNFTFLDSAKLKCEFRRRIDQELFDNLNLQIGYQF